MSYAWGSRSAIAGLRGAPPSPAPEAELWMGAHPVAPSIARSPHGDVSLLELIEASPVELLGERVAARFGGRLPFLMKVLAAERPLSLQAHPSTAQARAGFEREERAGVPRLAPHRLYKDASHKPELLCALGPFEALSGFREASEAHEVLGALGVPSLGGVVATLAEPGAAPVSRAFTALLTIEAGTRAELVADVGKAAAALAAKGGTLAPAYRWAARLAEEYPGDPGVVCSLLLRHVELAAGEALYLPAGNLHAYLRGVGVEIMASSDNVLRGGLTPKHVDVAELLAVLDFAGGPPVRVSPASRDGFRVYATAAAEFELSSVELRRDVAVSLEASGPEIVLALGEAVLTGRAGSVALGPVESAFLPAGSGRVEARGAGVLFRATVGA